MTEEEFMRRLRARFVEVAGEGTDGVVDGVGYDDWVDGHEDDPEGAADAEMEYWGVDEA